jgi:hypothetical protein
VLGEPHEVLVGLLDLTLEFGVLLRLFGLQAAALFGRLLHEGFHRRHIGRALRLERLDLFLDRLHFFSFGDMSGFPRDAGRFAAESCDGLRCFCA